MQFEWVRFFDRHRIDYRTSGANVGGTNIVIKCPFCGPRDRSEHMSVSTTGEGWHCWRDSGHSGVAPTKLIMALLHCDYTRAAEITGRSRRPSLPLGKTLVEAMSELLDPPPTPPTSPPDLKLPATLRPLSQFYRAARPYQDYLVRRGFNPADLDAFDVFFDAGGGRFHGRIVFVIKATPTRIVGFTGRTISRRVEPRYLFEGTTDATLLWSYKFPQQAHALCLCEGPFDALKVNVLGNRQGIYATCCLTSEFSRNQRAMLLDLMPRFDRVVALFDVGNEFAGFRLAGLFPGRIEPCSLPESVKDPAELNDLGFLT